MRAALWATYRFFWHSVGPPLAQFRQVVQIGQVVMRLGSGGQLAGRDAVGSCALWWVEEHCRSVEERVARAREWEEAARTRTEDVARDLTVAAT